jgi:hypothetical protein
MARQKSIIALEGTLGNITFFKSQDGYMAREKGGVTADKIANDPAFERTRENNAEFARAGKAAKVLRTAFRPVIQNASDSRMTSRLTAQMFAVIKQDTVNTRGQRNVIDGEAMLLQGFDFNNHGKLSTTIFAPYTVTLDRVTGNVAIDIPSFVPNQMITAPAGTTHFKVALAAADIDFENQTFNVLSNESAFIAWDNQPTAAVALTVQLPAASTHPLFALLDIEFVQDVNGTKYSLKNGAFNACSIVKVDTPA